MKSLSTLLVLSVPFLTMGQTGQNNSSCDSIYDTAEVMPYYSNGSIELSTYICNELVANMNYRMKMDMRIVLTIDKSGKVIDANFPGSTLTEQCDNQMKNKLLAMNGWTAGQHKGQFVCCHVQLDYLTFTNYNHTEDTSPDDFTKNWKSDSMGTKGFREKMIVWDSIQKTYLINGVNIEHFKKKEIIQMLGQPNFEGEIINNEIIYGGILWTLYRPHKTRTIFYILNKTCIVGGHTYTRSVKLEFRHKKVYEVSIAEPCKLE